MNSLDSLVILLSKFPGVGKKSATRMAYYLLDTDPSFSKNLAQRLAVLHDAIKQCSNCGGYTESDPCSICSDPSREGTSLCVVERPQDIRVIEEMKEFHGGYHVLNGLIAPLDGIGPDNLRISSLIKRIKNQEISELIIALNPSVEGDTTTLYLQNLLKDQGLTLTRLASGLPVGGDLEYADRLTLSRSFRGRIRL